MKKLATALIVSAAFSLPTSALALDSGFDAMSKSGKHKFYVWCTGKNDYTKSQSGKTAKAAQRSLASKVGSRCWPVWQGLQN